MKSIQALKEILMSKNSIILAQNTFMEEFNDIYQESGKRERNFLEGAIDQIYRKYYYSPVEPETYITPANIISALAERESAGSNVFVPRVELVKNKGKLTRIISTMHSVNSESHYMVTDFETVLEICKSGLGVSEFGIPEDGERKRFEGRLYLNDRHYLNIIVLAAINLQYMQIFPKGKKTMAVTTQKSKDLLNMSVKQKIHLLAEGMVNVFADTIDSGIPQLKGVITREFAWELLKNPSGFEGMIVKVNERIGIDIGPLKDMLQNNEVDFERLEDMLENSPASPLLLLFLTQLDIYFFTPLGYYLQLIKPFYNEVYNIVAETESILEALYEGFQHARNMLFTMPIDFDLTALGEEILLEGKKSKRKQKIPKKYNDESFLKCFELREEYLEEELADIYGDYDDYDEYDEYDDDDDGDDFYHGGERLFKDFSGEDDKVIDILSYKSEKENPTGKGKNQKYTQPIEIKRPLQDELYVIKVKNFYAKTVWIQLEIPGEKTLDDLHNVIGAEFNLEWGHLYSFFMSGKFWDSASEYCHPEADGRRKADRAKIGSLNLTAGSKFAFLYDYGDELRFELECKQVTQVEKGVKYPRIVKKSKRFIEEEE